MNVYCILVYIRSSSTVGGDRREEAIVKRLQSTHFNSKKSCNKISFIKLILELLQGKSWKPCCNNVYLVLTALNIVKNFLDYF